MFAGATIMLYVYSPGTFDWLMFGRTDTVLGIGWHFGSALALLGLGVAGAVYKRSLSYGVMLVVIAILLREPVWDFLSFLYPVPSVIPAHNPQIEAWLIAGGLLLIYFVARVLDSFWHWDYRRWAYAAAPMAVSFVPWIATGFHFSVPTVPDWPWNHDLLTAIFENGTWVVTCFGVGLQMLLDPAQRVPFSTFESKKQ